MTRRRDHGRAGYVLIEALATLALSALVLAGTATLIAVMLRASDRTALALEAAETTGRAVAAVERDVRSAVRLSRVVDGEPAMIFEGASDRLAVVLDRVDRDGISRPILVRWTSEATVAGRGRLLRSETPLVPGVDMPDDPPDSPAAVDTGQAVVRFAYFSPQPDGEGEVLTDGWTTTKTLPTAVRIGYGAPGSGEVERSIRVPIRSSAEMACLGGEVGYCSLTGRRGTTRRDRDQRGDDGSPRTVDAPQGGGAGRP